MTPLLGRLILCLGLLCCSALAAAAPITLTPASSGNSLNGQIELLEDVGAQLRIEDMARADIQQRFQPAAGRASVGLSPNPWWIK
ncbi:MAG: 7TM-DISM domain-containing protein, partial [Pseudomonas sp.]